VYNCVYYCETYLVEGDSSSHTMYLCIIIIGVVSVYIQYNWVYYCDTYRSKDVCRLVEGDSSSHTMYLYSVE
jgi:hypothetical protein